METICLYFNFGLRKPIPEDLYNRVWIASGEDDFWESNVRAELENYLGMKVYEINRTTID